MKKVIISQNLILMLCAVVLLFCGCKKTDVSDITGNTAEITTAESLAETSADLTESETVHTTEPVKDVLASPYYHGYNIVNTSHVVRNEKWIYYIDINQSITRMSPDGTNKTVLIDQYNCDEIILRSSSLYFLSLEDQTLYRANLDGAQVQSVLTGKIGWFGMTEDAIYYINSIDDENGQLYKCDLFGSNTTKITDMVVRSVNLTENEIYFMSSEDGTIYRSDMNGENIETVYTREPGYYYGSFFKVYRDVLYYAKTNNSHIEDDSIDAVEKNIIYKEGIFGLDLTTGKTVQIVSDIISQSRDFTFYKNQLIYGHGRKNENWTTVNMVSLSGGDPVKLGDQYLQKSVVLGNMLYGQYLDEIGWVTFCIDLDTGAYQNLDQDIYKSLICEGNHLFYIDKRDKDVYRCELDGQNLCKMTNTSCDALFDRQGKVYGCVNQAPRGLFQMPEYAKGYYYGENDTDRDNGKSIIDQKTGVIDLSIHGTDSDYYESHVFAAIGQQQYAFYKNYIYFGNGSLKDIAGGLLRISLEDALKGNKPESIDVIDDDFEGGHLFAFELWGPTETINNRVSEDWIYLNAANVAPGGGVVYFARMRPDGSKFEKISNSCADKYRIYDDKIYHYVRGELSVMELDGSNMQLLLDGVIDYLIKDCKIYYLSENREFCSMNLDGSGITQLSNSYCADFTVTNDTVYYTDLRDNGAIWAMNLDGSNLRQIISNESAYVDVSAQLTKHMTN